MPLPESIAPEPSSPSVISSRSLKEMTLPAAPVQQRPFRVKLRGSVLTLLRLPNRREVRGKLHQISTSGGLMNLESPLAEKLEVELVFQLGETTVREKVQMMFPMWATQGWLQPFRFLDMLPQNHRVLEKSLLHFVQNPPAH